MNYLALDFLIVMMKQQDTTENQDNLFAEYLPGTFTQWVADNIDHNWASEASPTLGCSIEISRDIYIYYIPPPLTVHFSMMRSVRYQPILHTLYYTLQTEHVYCLSYRFLNNVVKSVQLS